MQGRAVAERVDDLRAECTALRLDVIRLHQAAGASHLGSSLSIVDVLTVLFDRHFRWSGQDDEGDRFVLSKGHAALALYCTLARHGRIPPARLNSFGQNGSSLEPHPNERAEPAVGV